MNSKIKEKLAIVRHYVKKSDIVLEERAGYIETFFEFEKDHIAVGNGYHLVEIPHEKIVDITIDNSIVIYWNSGEGENEFTQNYRFVPVVYATNVFKEH